MELAPAPEANDVVVTSSQSLMPAAVVTADRAEQFSSVSCSKEVLIVYVSEVSQGASARGHHPRGFRPVGPCLCGAPQWMTPSLPREEFDLTSKRRDRFRPGVDDLAGSLGLSFEVSMFTCVIPRSTIHT